MSKIRLLLPLIALLGLTAYAWGQNKVALPVGSEGTDKNGAICYWDGEHWWRYIRSETPVPSDEVTPSANQTLNPIALETVAVPAIKIKVREESNDWACMDHRANTARRKNGGFTSFLAGVPNWADSLPECTDATRPDFFGGNKKIVYACADKTRVLLTTEEGKKICVRF